MVSTRSRVFVSEVLNTQIYDEVIRVKTDDTFDFARRAARKVGLLLGISSGAALWAAAEVAERFENAGKLIVVTIPRSASATSVRHCSPD